MSHVNGPASPGTGSAEAGTAGTGRARRKIVMPWKRLGKKDKKIPLPFSDASDVYELAVNAGHVAFNNQDHAEAIKQFKSALSVNPAGFEARVYLGTIFNAQNMLVEAREHLEAAVKLRKDDGVTLHELAVVLEKLGKKGEALFFHQQASRSGWAVSANGAGRLAGEGVTPVDVFKAWDEEVEIEAAMRRLQEEQARELESRERVIQAAKEAENHKHEAKTRVQAELDARRREKIRKVREAAARIRYKEALATRALQDGETGKVVILLTSAARMASILGWAGKAEQLDVDVRRMESYHHDLRIATARAKERLDSTTNGFIVVVTRRLEAGLEVARKDASKRSDKQSMERALFLQFEMELEKLQKARDLVLAPVLGTIGELARRLDGFGEGDMLRTWVQQRLNEFNAMLQSATTKQARFLQAWIEHGGIPDPMKPGYVPVKTPPAVKEKAVFIPVSLPVHKDGVSTPSSPDLGGGDGDGEITGPGPPRMKLTFSLYRDKK